MDYDIGVLGLANPPASAVVTSYRPAVQVRNNGIHNAIASGYLRIYSAGLLIFETEVYSGTLTPGATGTADAVDYWTPPDEGTYIIQGYVTTPLDQVEPNNNLNPTTIIVAGGPVPPPPTVPLHAAQHEEGGTDPVNVDGLPGVLADRQPAQPHAAQHQAGGDDAVNVGGLAGILGEPQTPIVHGNAHHSPAMATSADIAAHAGASSAHTAATNLANRETTGPETGLVKGEQLAIGSVVPASLYNALRNDRYFGPAKHASLGVNMPIVQVTPGTSPRDILSLLIPAAWLSDDMQFLLKTNCYVACPGSADTTIQLELLLGTTSLALTALDLTGATLHPLIIEAGMSGLPTLKCNGYVHPSWPIPVSFYTLIAPVFSTTPRNYTIGDRTLRLEAQVFSGAPAATLSAYGGIIRGLSPIP